mgnify:CR=1 FL=1
MKVLKDLINNLIVKKITAIVEARVNSKRLPNKVLLPILKKPVLYHLVKRLKLSKKIQQIIVATSNKSKDDEIKNFCEKNKILYFRGSESNVRERVFLAAKKFRADPIIQITADCPLIDPNIVDKVISNYFSGNYDYVSNSLKRSYPDGMDVAVFSFESFRKINSICKKINKKIYNEHTSLFYIHNYKKFKTKNIPAPTGLRFPDLGLTLDEKKDFILIEKIFKYFKKRKKYFFNCKDVIKLVHSNKELYNINKFVIRKKIPLKQMHK